MISYPFFGDQPLLAARCERLGLAVPLVEEPRSIITAKNIIAALARIREDSDVFGARLHEARSWERRAISNRSLAIDRITALAEKL